MNRHDNPKLVAEVEANLRRPLSDNEARVLQEVAKEARVGYALDSLGNAWERDAFRALATTATVPQMPSMLAFVALVGRFDDAVKQRCGSATPTETDLRACALELAQEADSRCCRGRKSGLFKSVVYGELLDFYYCCVEVPTASRRNETSRRPSALVQFLHAFLKHADSIVRQWLFTRHGEPIARLLRDWEREVAPRSVPYMRKRLSGLAGPTIPIVGGLDKPMSPLPLWLPGGYGYEPFWAQEDRIG